MAEDFTNIKKLVIDVPRQLQPSKPALVLNSFGIPFLQTEIYKGKIPITSKDAAPVNRKSQLGTAIFSDLQFKSIVGMGAHVPVDTCLFDVTQAKRIVRTSINNRDGQIKQYLGLDDYEVNVKGIITSGQNGVYPFDAVLNLVQFFRYDQSLGIVSKYLNEIFDINEVVVKDYHFEQSEGSQSYQKFEATFWSEKPVEILISEAK